MAAGKWIRTSLSFPARPGALVACGFAAAALAACLGGCSLIGLGVGSAINSTRSKEALLLSPERAAFLEKGSAVTLVMLDSTTITGVVLDPEFSNGVDSRQVGVRIAHLRSASPATLDTLLVPLDEIAYARSPRQYHAARAGFRAGATADLAVLGIIAVAVLLLLFFLLILSSSGFSLG